MNEVIARLESGRAKIEGGWTQRALSRDNGKLKQVLTGVAPTSYCMVGAVNVYGGEVTDRIGYEALNYLRAAITNSRIRYYYIPAWNDEEGRTKEEVLAVFDKAIRLAKADATIEDLKQIPTPVTKKELVESDRTLIDA